MQAGWSGWRRLTGVVCDRRVTARVKGKVYKTAVRPAMLEGLEAELEEVELKMLRLSLGEARMDRIRNDYITGTAQEGRFRDIVRETILRWCGHVQRRDAGYVVRRMLRMEPPGRRRGGRPKRRFMDVVKEDMQVVGVTEEDEEDRTG